jgi:two-component system cell cycle sensor histidine kinase/response regulator CckA
VLVMDDEPSLRRLAVCMLERGGYEVVTAAHGEEALERCAAAERDGRPFAVAILDLTVPGAMGGREAFRRLARAHPRLPVILSSGYVQDGWEEDDVRPSAVLPKPYQLHELLACVRAVTAPGHGSSAE